MPRSQSPPPAHISVHLAGRVCVPTSRVPTSLAPTNAAHRLPPANSRERASAKSVSSRCLCVTWVADCLMPEPNPGEESCLSSITNCDKTTGPAPWVKKVLPQRAGIAAGPVA